MSVTITCFPEYLTIEVIASREVARKLELGELGFKWDEEMLTWTRDFPATTEGGEIVRVAEEVFEKAKGVEGVELVTVFCDVRGLTPYAVKTWRKREVEFEKFLELADKRKDPLPIRNYWLKEIAAHLRGAMETGFIKPDDTIGGTAIDKLLGLR